jgi:hypothetical protein
MKHLRKLTVGAALVLAVAGGGAAIAATQLTPKQESQAVLNDAAKQLGVSAENLSAALKQALKNRVDAAVAAGRLTQAQGAELKQRIDSGEVPLLGLGGPGGPGFHRHGHGDELAVAAKYLGVTQAALRTSLSNGKTLAQVAKAQGKSVDGLVAALVKAEQAEWAAAVKAGRMTDAQRDAMLPTLEQRMTDLVNGTGGPGRHGRGFGPPPPGGFGAVVAPPESGTAA